MCLLTTSEAMTATSATCCDFFPKKRKAPPKASGAPPVALQSIRKVFPNQHLCTKVLFAISKTKITKSPLSPFNLSKTTWPNQLLS